MKLAGIILLSFLLVSMTGFPGIYGLTAAAEDAQEEAFQEEGLAEEEAMEDEEAYEEEGAAPEDEQDQGDDLSPEEEAGLI